MNQEDKIVVFRRGTGRACEFLIGYAQFIDGKWLLRFYDQKQPFVPLPWYREEKTFSSIEEAHDFFDKTAIEQGYIRNAGDTRTVTISDEE